MPGPSSLMLFEPHPFLFAQQGVLLSSDHGHGKSPWSGKMWSYSSWLGVTLQRHSAPL
jgi:hypothetical protein